MSVRVNVQVQQCSPYNENEYSVYTVDFSNPSFNTNTFITF